MTEKLDWTWSPERPDDWEEFIEWYENHREDILRAMNSITAESMG